MPRVGSALREMRGDVTPGEVRGIVAIVIGWVVAWGGIRLGYPFAGVIGGLVMGFTGGWAMGYLQAEIDLTEPDEDGNA